LKKGLLLEGSGELASLGDNLEGGLSDEAQALRSIEVISRNSERGNRIVDVFFIAAFCTPGKRRKEGVRIAV